MLRVYNKEDKLIFESKEFTNIITFASNSDSIGILLNDKFGDDWDRIELSDLVINRKDII